MAENNNARQASVAIGKHFGGEWVPSAHKWFPTEANGYRAHVLENILGANERHRPLSDARVGAYCIRPRCSWPRTIAPIGHPPQLGNISGANERHRPLSDVRVGAQKHTPPMFRVGNNSARQASAAIGKHFGGERTTAAIVGRQRRGVLHTPPMFRAENNSARQISAAIGKHFGGERTTSAIVGRPCRGVLHTPPPCSWPRTIAPDRHPPQSDSIL